jgi:hypothetical protein
MRIHLSGWQRLGISIIWIVGSFIGFRWQIVHERLSESERACVSRGQTLTECYAANHPLDAPNDAPDPVYDWRRGDLTTLSLISFGGVPIFWLIGWASIKTIRWVKAGFGAG